MIVMYPRQCVHNRSQCNWWMHGCVYVYSVKLWCNRFDCPVLHELHESQLQRTLLYTAFPIYAWLIPQTNPKLEDHTNLDTADPF